MRVHFFHRHVRDTVIILEEGNIPQPWCPCCDILVPWRALNGLHITTTQCAEEVERKQRRMGEYEMQESEDRAFQAYARPLETVTSFKYMGRVLTTADNY